MKSVSSSGVSPKESQRDWNRWQLLVATLMCCPLMVLISSWWHWSSVTPTSSTRPPFYTATDAIFNDTTIELDPCHDKEHLLKIVESTGIRLVNNTTRRIICEMMPTWTQVTSLYGNKPRILGLDTCQKYRNMLAQANVSSLVPIYSMPRVAGLHNSGTNALADTFFDNLAMNPSVRSNNPRVYNTPWRKHTPLEYRYNVTARLYDWHENKHHVLPVVVIRDPYRWMAGMCKLHYNVRWAKDARHCPNLVAYPDNRSEFMLKPSVHVWLDLKEPTLRTSVEYESLVHMWSNWNQQYVEADFPRLVVRYEDTLYHSEQVFRAIAECAGIPLKHDTFRPFALRASSKKNTSNDLVSALAKNGVNHDRFSRMTTNDIAFAKEHLDPELLLLFHYKHQDDVPVQSFAASDLAKRGLD
ncbi:hypothetical protein MPSEU_000990200 [Mayamaea pseudoterrestris]|nr:hypothetical protein MPSEU_000990200 [Mayamaea pseudoterrestris]